METLNYEEIKADIIAYVREYSLREHSRIRLLMLKKYPTLSIIKFYDLLDEVRSMI